MNLRQLLRFRKGCFRTWGDTCVESRLPFALLRLQASVGPRCRTNLFCDRNIACVAKRCQTFLSQKVGQCRVLVSQAVSLRRKMAGNTALVCRDFEWHLAEKEKRDPECLGWPLASVKESKRASPSAPRQRPLN